MINSKKTRVVVAAILLSAGLLAPQSAGAHGFGGGGHFGGGSGGFSRGNFSRGGMSNRNFSRNFNQGRNRSSIVPAQNGNTGFSGLGVRQSRGQNVKNMQKGSFVKNLNKMNGSTGGNRGMNGNIGANRNGLAKNGKKGNRQGNGMGMANRQQRGQLLAQLALLGLGSLGSGGGDDSGGGGGSSGGGDSSGDDGGQMTSDAGPQGNAQSLADAQQAPPADAGMADNGPVNDGPANNGPAYNGPVNNGPVNNGSMNNGSMNNGPVNNARMNNGPMIGGAVNNGATNNGRVNNGQANAQQQTANDVPPTRIDLVLEDVQLAGPATAVAGPAYRIRFRNQGTEAAGPFAVAILAGDNGNLTKEAPRALVAMPGLEAGETNEVTLRLPMAATKLVSKTSQTPAMFSRLFVAVDLTGRIAELDKSNNGAVLNRTDLEPAAQADAEPAAEAQPAAEKPADQSADTADKTAAADASQTPADQQ